MDQTQLGRGLLTAGIVGFFGSMIWWAGFYSEATRRMGGRGQLNSFECLFTSHVGCDFIKGLARAAGYVAYDPVFIWISMFVAGAGVVVMMTDQTPSSTGYEKAKPVSLGRTATAKRPEYDRAKWSALLQYDDDIAKVANMLERFGQKWVDEFAKSYLALNDKEYLPVIVRKLLARIKEDEERRKQTAPPESERFVWTIYETEHGLIFISTRRILYFTDGVTIRRFESMESYRVENNDSSTWFEVTDGEKRKKLMGDNPKVLEAMDVDDKSTR